MYSILHKAVNLKSNICSPYLRYYLISIQWKMRVFESNIRMSTYNRSYGITRSQRLIFYLPTIRPSLMTSKSCRNNSRQNYLGWKSNQVIIIIEWVFINNLYMQQKLSQQNKMTWNMYCRLKLRWRVYLFNQSVVITSKNPNDVSVDTSLYSTIYILQTVVYLLWNAFVFQNRVNERFHINYTNSN